MGSGRIVDQGVNQTGTPCEFRKPALETSRLPQRATLSRAHTWSQVPAVQMRRHPPESPRDRLKQLALDNLSATEVDRLNLASERVLDFLAS